MPLIPGHEFSGQVVQTGENADVKWQNKRVGIFPLIPCHNCVACQKGQYELCRNYSYLGSRRDRWICVEQQMQCRECNLIETVSGKCFIVRKRQCLNRCRWHAMHCAV
ncbi:MAG: alcohol dehydrogenase catalytic domain-containing protein [Lachnospira sp.]